MSEFPDEITLELESQGNKGFEPKYPQSREGEKTGREGVDQLRQISRALERLTVNNPNMFYGNRGFFSGSREAEVVVPAGQKRDGRGRFVSAQEGVTGDADPTADAVWRARTPEYPLEEGGRFRSPYTGGFISAGAAQQMRQRASDWEWDEGGSREPHSVVEERERFARETREIVKGLNLPEQRERFEEYDQIQEGWNNRNRRSRLRSFMSDSPDRTRSRWNQDVVEDLAAFENDADPIRPAAPAKNPVAWWNRPLWGSAKSGGGSAGGGNGNGGGGSGTGGGEGGDEGNGGAGRGNRAGGVINPAVQGMTGSSAAGRFAQGITNAFGGGTAATLGGAVIGAAAAIALYELSPLVQAEYRKRSQFREAWIDRETMTARGRSIMGKGMPVGTMEGQENFDPANASPGQSPSMAPKKEWSAADPFGFAGVVDRNTAPNYAFQPALTDEERRRIDESSAQKMGITIEEFNRRREVRRKALGPQAAKGNYARARNVDDPEDFPAQDQLNPDPAIFDPEDMRLGINMAPVLSSLKAHGYSTDNSPNSKGAFPRDYTGTDVMRYHRPKTDAERNHPGALERDKRLENTPRAGDVGWKIAQDQKAFEDWAFNKDQQPFQPRPGEMIADAAKDPVFMFVQSPYGGMSA